MNFEQIDRVEIEIRRVDVAERSVVNRCVTETVWPATVTDPTRSVFVPLTETVKEAGPLPVLAAAGEAMKLSAVDSVQTQFAALAVTVTLADCADASRKIAEGATVNEHVWASAREAKTAAKMTAVAARSRQAPAPGRMAPIPLTMRGQSA